MKNTHGPAGAQEKPDLNIWYCGSCGLVHLAAGDTTLNFDREEFAQFTESVVDIHYSGFLPEGQFAASDLTSGAIN